MSRGYFDALKLRLERAVAILAEPAYQMFGAGQGAVKDRETMNGATWELKRAIDILDGMPEMQNDREGTRKNMIVNHVNVTERIARLLCRDKESDARYVSDNKRIVGDDGTVYEAGVPRWRAWEDRAHEIVRMVMTILYEGTARKGKE